MEPIVSRIHKSLLKKKKTVAVAESCTGGLLSSLLTRLSGSSKYFLAGFVTYSNESKKRVLGIPGGLLKLKGAVSRETAQAMAKSARAIARSDLGIGITGIAGPTGATPGKPVGTVFIAVNSSGRKICRKMRFKGTRSGIQKAAALKALSLLKGMI